jgi:ABC-type microcin C transport system permease subunit YejE
LGHTGAITFTSVMPWQVLKVMLEKDIKRTIFLVLLLIFLFSFLGLVLVVESAVLKDIF